MRADKKSKQALNSTARLSHIDVFLPAQIAFDHRSDHSLAHFSRFKYTDLSLQLSPIEDGVIRRFPILLRGDGTPWDLGNLYLMRTFTEKAKLAPPSYRNTHIDRQALSYVSTLRWIEDARTKGIDIHELYFPLEEERRVTWAYYRYLKRLLRQTNDQPISLNVARARMQTVVGFYRGLLKWSLVEESAFENVAYKTTLIGIPIVNSVGIRFMKTVETTNFKISKPSRTHVGVIMDGSALRPLTEEEQVLVLEQLRASNNRAFQLMCLVSLHTGARIQTSCTLRVKDIFNLLKKSSGNGEALLPVGGGTGIDTKNEKRYRLHFPYELVCLLRDYVESDESRERRALSFYGESEENYVFLAHNGSPFYTSSREIIDRQEGQFSRRISTKDRVTFKIQKGNAVRNYLSRLVRDIRLKHPDFNSIQVHDLRATYGMNYVRDAEAAGAKDICDELKERMGRSSFDTTQDYLNFDLNNAMVRAANEFHHDRINRVVREFRA